MSLTLHHFAARWEVEEYSILFFAENVNSQNELDRDRDMSENTDSRSIQTRDYGKKARICSG